MIRYILIIIIISIVQSGCYTTLDIPEYHSEDNTEDFDPFLQNPKIIGLWSRVYSNGGYGYIRFYLRFYHEGSFSLGMNKKTYDYMHNSRYVCTDDTLKIIRDNSPAVYTVNFLNHDSTVVIKLIYAAHPIDVNDYQYEGTWHRVLK